MALKINNCEINLGLKNLTLEKMGGAAEKNSGAWKFAIGEMVTPRKLSLYEKEGASGKLA